MTARIQKVLSATALAVPPVILFRDKFYSTYSVKDDSMEPILRRNDIVLVRKADFFPYYHKHGLGMGDLEMSDSSPKIDEETDRIKTMRMDAAVGSQPINEYTIWSSPPISLPGDVIAIKNPQRFSSDNVEMKRIIGLGGQRVRQRSY